MSRVQSTNYKENKEASAYQRITGKQCYGADADMIYYTYQDGQVKFSAICDYKYPGKTLSDTYSPMQMQIALADQLKIPFLAIITFLDDSYPTKCYYIVPYNDYAKRYFAKCELNTAGDWFSLRAFSKLQHALRGKVWDKSETISSVNLGAVGLPAGTTLGQLSNAVDTTYHLPEIK